MSIVFLNPVACHHMRKMLRFMFFFRALLSGVFCLLPVLINILTSFFLQCRFGCSRDFWSCSRQRTTVRTLATMIVVMPKTVTVMMMSGTMSANGMSNNVMLLGMRMSNLANILTSSPLCPSAVTRYLTKEPVSAYMLQGMSAYIMGYLHEYFSRCFVLVVRMSRFCFILVPCLKSSLLVFSQLAWLFASKEFSNKRSRHVQIKWTRAERSFYCTLTQAAC